jgi:hypothetical protein
MPDDTGSKLGAVRKHGGRVIRAVHNMRTGEEVAIVGDDRGAAGAAAARGGDEKADNTRQHSLRDGNYGARLGVEGVRIAALDVGGIASRGLTVTVHTGIVGTRGLRMTRRSLRVRLRLGEVRSKDGSSTEQSCGARRRGKRNPRKCGG